MLARLQRRLQLVTMAKTREIRAAMERPLRSGSGSGDTSDSASSSSDLAPAVPGAPGLSSSLETDTPAA